MILTDLSLYKIVVTTWYTLNKSLSQSEKKCTLHFIPEFPNLSTCAWLGNPYWTNQSSANQSIRDTWLKLRMKQSSTHTCDSWPPRLFTWEGPRAITGNPGPFLLIPPRAPRPKNLLPPEPRPRNTKPPIPGRPMLDCLGLLTLEGTKGVWLLRLSMSSAKLILSSMRALLKMASLPCKWSAKVFLLRGLPGIPNFLGFTLLLTTRLLLLPGGNFNLFMCRTPDSVSSMLLAGKDAVICILLKWLDNLTSTKLLFTRWQGCNGFPFGWELLGSYKDGGL